MLDVEIIDDLDTACSLAPAWDELAVRQALPLCAPGWMLAWWRHVASSEGRLRIVAVHEGDELVALAPWHISSPEGGRIDVRFLGAELSDRVDVLCAPGREHEVAQVLRRVLARIDPRPDLIAFEAVPIGSRWTRRLAGGWRGRLMLGRYRNSARPAPTVALPAGPPEQWLAGRSRNFRSQMGRARRQLAQRDGQVRQIVDPSEVERALDALLRLHAARWEGRAPSGLARPGVSELLHEAAAALGPDRLRLWAAEIAGELISVQLFHAAGGEIKYWNGGWLEEHAGLKPTMLTILAALEDGIARGERRLDLGAGTHPYKLRFADGNDSLTWGGLIVRNRRWPRTAVELAPAVLRQRAKVLVRSLPTPLAERAEALAKRSRLRT
jgi:CelD/BcsL family acetyltransferase involved in cellulose biosynthesis